MRKSAFRWLAVFSLGVPVVLVGGCMLVGHDFGGGSKLQRVPADFNAIDSALQRYVIDAGEPPATHQGLEALVTMPATAPVPKRWSQIMKKEPLDPWMTEYRYRRIPLPHGRFGWELRSAGPDGVFGNADDESKLFGR